MNKPAEYVDMLFGDIDDLGANWLPSGNWLPGGKKAETPSILPPSGNILPTKGELVTSALGLPDPKKLALYGAVGIGGIILLVILIKRRG